MPEDRPSRIVFLRSKVESAERNPEHSTFTVPFRGQPKTLVQIEVRTDFPRYRVQSGRTRRAHAEYLDQHPELPTDFFADSEDPRVQTAQHQILVNLITEAGLDKDLRDRGQWNPLVLTYDGYVVDGNRRLCALRENGEQYVKAVVLPEDAEAAEIYETEVELQMAAETKAPYNWIDEALHIRYGIEELREKEEVVAARMRMGVAAIRNAIAQLSVVDMYLEWLGKPGKYHLIPAERHGASQEAFLELTQKLSAQTTQRQSREEQRAIREACFAAIYKRGGYKDVRRIVKYLRSRPQDFLSRVKENIPEGLSQKIAEPPPGEQQQEVHESEGRSDNLLAELARSEPVPESHIAQDILEMVSDPDRAHQSGEILMRVAEDLEAEDTETKRLTQPLQRIQKALREASKVELHSETQGLDEIASTLAQLMTEVERLIAKINSLRAERE